MTDGAADNQGSVHGPLWRSPAWLAAFAGIVSALVAVLALFANIGGGRTSSDAPVTAAGRGSASTEHRAGRGPTGSDVLTVAVAQHGQNTTDQRVQEYFLLPANTVALDEIRPENDDLSSYLSSRNAINAGDQSISLVVRAIGDKRVVIRSIRPKVIERRKPLSGLVLNHPFGCGVNPIRSVLIDLDKEPPEVEYALENESPPVKQLILSVTSNEPEVISVTANSRVKDVFWLIVISFEVDGKLGALDVSDNGRPFRVSGVAPGAPTYQYHYSTGPVRTPENDTRPLDVPIC